MRSGMIGLVMLAMALLALAIHPLSARPAMAQASSAEPTLAAFLEQANRIPRNAMAAVHPARGRVQTQFQNAMRLVMREQREAEAAGRPARTCLPPRISLNPFDVLDFLNRIPASRRTMPLSQGVREWANHAYPCPG